MGNYSQNLPYFPYDTHSLRDSSGVTVPVLVLYPYHIFGKKSTDNIARFLFFNLGVDSV